MCIHDITNRKPKKTGMGWKVFMDEKGKLFGDCHGAIDRPRPVRQWLRAKDFRDGNVRPEVDGFHIFVRKRDAESWRLLGRKVVCRVRYRKATLRGTQYIGVQAPVILASEIYIL